MTVVQTLGGGLHGGAGREGEGRSGEEVDQMFVFEKRVTE